MNTLNPEPEQTPTIANQLAIQALLAQSAYALDERLMDTLEECFAADASLQIVIAGADPIDFDGRDTIMGLMRDSADTQTDVRRHVTTNTFFTPTGAERDGELSATSNLTITAVENGAIRLVTSGYYKDTFVQQQGHWKIRLRRIELDMAY